MFSYGLRSECADLLNRYILSYHTLSALANPVCWLPTVFHRITSIVFSINQYIFFIFYAILPSLTLVNPKSRSKAFIYQAGATFQFRSDMCYILSCGSWFDFFGAFYDIPHLRFGNEFDIGMKAKMGM